MRGGRDLCLGARHQNSALLPNPALSYHEYSTAQRSHILPGLVVLVSLLLDPPLTPFFGDTHITTVCRDRCRGGRIEPRPRNPASKKECSSVLASMGEARPTETRAQIINSCVADVHTACYVCDHGNPSPYL